ncbi:MAG TPA: ShlB/FhaC/HecB family hemolysin secretion/activation protein [Acidiphilium sp.]|nr:MAG: peptide ABC transporter permease [Acidiphilium sp. 21-60-14]OYV91699.1 MAG: peptide ABC transporter permease [Acidiphilium sp. 37-60-79]HQT87764.1 ShlB/FhaC/HecB family hemolysin secretion/activation protein [Acidiphilium sp.]
MDGQAGRDTGRRALRRGVALGLAYGVVGLVLSGQAFGQSPLQAPGAAVPQVSPLEHMLPPAKQKLGTGLPNFQPVGPAAAMPNETVSINAVTIIGATAFPQAKLAPIMAGLTGSAVSLARIDAARRGLLNLYRDHGYVLTAVSAEINKAGDLRFIVTEGRIVSVKLSRNIGPAGALVLGFLDHLTYERPVREASLEHWLLLAEQTPGVDVHAVLEPNAAAPGALTLVAEVSHKVVGGLLTVDNRAYRDTGPIEALGVFDLNSLTRFGDQTQLSLFHSSHGTDNFGQFTESFFVGTDGVRVSLYGGTGRAQPTGPLALIGYHSFISLFGASASYPLMLRRGQALTGVIKFDASDNVIDTQGSVASDDAVRALRVQLDYDIADNLFDNRAALTSMQVVFSKGLPFLGASADRRGAPPSGRLGERIDFWKINAVISRTQTLFSPWVGASVALRAAAGGQFTTDILPTSEEFYLGGSQFTRGYYSGEVTGDKAVYATAELDLNTDLNFHAFSRQIETGAQFYGFYDYGENFQNNQIAGQVSADHRLASFGGGVRLGLTRYLELDVEGVHRLVTQLVPVGAGQPLSETAVYWAVTARY